MTVRDPEHDDTTPQWRVGQDVMIPARVLNLYDFDDELGWQAAEVLAGSKRTLVSTAALAATSPCPYVETSDEGTSFCGLAAGSGRAASPDTPGENGLEVAATGDTDPPPPGHWEYDADGDPIYRRRDAFVDRLGNPWTFVTWEEFHFGSDNVPYSLWVEAKHAIARRASGDRPPEPGDTP